MIHLAISKVDLIDLKIEYIVNDFINLDESH